MKFGYHALRWGWQKMSFSAIAESIHNTGFKGFEIICGDGCWGNKGKYFPFGGDKARVLDVISEKGLELISVYNFGNYIRGVDYNFRGIPNHFWWRHRHIPKMVKFTASVGCKKLVFGGGYPHLKREEDMRARDFQKMAKLLDEVGTACNNYGVQFSYHPHPEPHPYTIQNKEQIDKLLELTNPDLLHLALDTGLSAGGIDLVGIIRTYGKRIGHVHFKDYENGDFLDLGEGTIDFPLIVKTLRSAGYDDWITIEDWYPPVTTRTPAESAKSSKEYVDKFLVAPGDTF